MKSLIPIGILIIFIGIIFLIIGSLSQHQKTDTKFFAGGIIGFIPFGFGNDKKIFYIGLVLTIILFLTAFFLRLK